MKRKHKSLSLAAIILAAALSLSACQKVDDNPIITDTTPATTESLTKMTEETTTPPPILTTTTATTTQPETTVSSESETTIVPETTVSETTVTAAASTSVSSNGKWSETPNSRTLYTNQTCYSRVEAVLGAQIVKEYQAGTALQIVADTDTGYCKLTDGTFIHSDYLSTSGTAVVTTAAVTTARPAVTTSGQGSVITSTSYNTSYTSRYFWNQLSADEQALYANIVAAAENYYTGQIEVSPNLLSNDRLKIYFLVFNNEPQLFWLDTSASVSAFGFSLKYCVPQSDIPTIQSEIDANVSTIMKTASGASDLNKIKIFYDWIVLNNEFHLDNSPEACGIEHGLRPHAGDLQCNGYAKSMQYLCDIAGIPCMTIPGESTRAATHAWNKLEIGGKWYNIDPTRGDPINKYDSKYISYAYYLVPDSWIADSHLMPNQKKLSTGTVLTYFTPPACTDSSLNYYRLYNKEFSTTDSAFKGICAELKTALGKGANVAAIRVTSADVYNTVGSSTYWKAAQDYARTIVPGVKLYPQTTDHAGVMVIECNIDY
jgi:transglutaminase/protease-like cytokinesis protein 3